MLEVSNTPDNDSKLVIKSESLSEEVADEVEPQTNVTENFVEDKKDISISENETSINPPTIRVKNNSSLGIKSTTPVKRARGLIVEDDFNVPVPEGWRRQVVQRQAGLSAGKFDVYYFSPLGKKLRSRKEVQSYCSMNNLSCDLEMFQFSQSHLDGSSKKKRKSLPATLKPPKIKKDLTSTPIDIKKKVKKAYAENSSDLKSTKKSSNLKFKPKKMSFKVSNAILTKRKKSFWVPPKSPFNLYQENLFQNPWKLLVGTIFHTRLPNEEGNGSTWSNKFFDKWPTAEDTLKSSWEHIAQFLISTPNSEKTAKLIWKFTEEYSSRDWKYPKELQGIGKYGNDSYRIFCVNEWRKVKPTDYLLNFYVSWVWDNHTVLGLP